MTSSPSYLGRDSGLTASSYQDSGYGGSKVDTPPTLSSASYPPHGSIYNSTSPPSYLVNQQSQSQSRLHWLGPKIESWFGTSERFEGNFVQASRLVLVDCVTYPFTVFSHQCQFYPYNAVSASLTAPFSTLVVLNNIVNSQSMSALWRGWRSHVLLLLAQPFLDALLTKLLLLSGRTQGGASYWMQMLVIKSLPFLATIPLVSYTYLDMVQTTKDKVHITLGESVFDLPVVKQDEFRRVPILYLAPPTVLHGLLSGVVSALIRKVAQRLFTSRNPSHSQLTPVTSAVGALWLDYFSMFLSDLLLYPLETVLVRLYCQGMPALADNIQNGVEQTFVSSYYSGVMDCVTGVYDSEGGLGFFKGFSSLLIRYSIHGLLLLLLWRTAHTLENRLRRI